MIFIYEMQTQFFKVSLRSNGKVDVPYHLHFSEAADMCVQPAVICRGSMYDVINNLTAEIEKQLAEE